MKTSDLIKKLQEQDPSGQLDVVVSGQPISCVQNLPGYYDGRFLRKIYENDKLVGAKYCAKDRKIELYTWDLDSALLDNPDLPVDCSEATHYESRVQQMRLDNITILDKIERDAFKEFVTLTVLAVFDFEIDDWYDKLGLSWRDPLPKYPDYGLSIHDRRLNGWKERFEVLIEDNVLVVRDKKLAKLKELQEVNSAEEYCG